MTADNDGIQFPKYHRRTLDYKSAVNGSTEKKTISVFSIFQGVKHKLFVHPASEWWFNSNLGSRNMDG